MHAFWSDVRYALRIARRAPRFSAVAVACLALGIGANTAVFSVFNALLLRPLPYRDAGRLIFVFETNAARGWRQAAVCPADFVDWREQAQSFEGFAAYRAWTPSLTGVPQPERLVGLQASGALFDVLGAGAAAGRALRPDDERGNLHVAVVSHALWQRAFAGDPRLVGRTVRLDGTSYVVVGIMAPGFQFPTREIDIWTPLNLDGTRHQRGEHELRVVARLRGGVPDDQGRAELAALMTRIDARTGNAGCGADFVPLREAFIGGTRRTLWMLFGAVALVLLIACANVANLLLAYGSTRDQELAVRAVLGASRSRLVAQRLAECLVLAVAGAALGLGISVWSRDALLALLPDTSTYRLLPPTVDWRVLAYTAALSVLTAIIFGVVPAIRASRADGLRLQSATRVAPARLRSALLVAQTALAVTLLAGAGLLVRSFLHILELDPGFSSKHVVTARVNLPSQYAEARQPAFYDDVLVRLRATQGVEAAGAISHLPLGGGGNSGYISFEDRPAPPPEAIDRPAAERLIVTPGLFEALDVRLLEGRLFTDTDTRTAPAVVVVNSAFARRYWPGASPLGRRIKRGTPQAPFPWLTIVGVVADIRHGSLTTAGAPAIYLAHQQTPSAGMTLVARGPDATALASRIRAAVREIDPDLPMAAARTLDDVVFGSLAGRWLPTLWMSVFAALAVALAALGVYGVVSYAVARRAREFGIRMALGADGNDLVRLALRQGMIPVASGAALGVAAASGLTGLLGSLVHGIAPTDGPTLAGSAAVLLIAGFAASYPPARRVLRQDPTAALRQD